MKLAPDSRFTIQLWRHIFNPIQGKKLEEAEKYLEQAERNLEQAETNENKLEQLRTS